MSRLPALRWRGTIWLFAALGSCDRPEAPIRVDTAGQTAPTTALPADAPVDAGIGALGSLLVVPGDSAGAGIVIFPESPTAQLVGAGPLKLFAPSGDSVLAPAALVMTDSQVCGEAPLIRVQDSLATSWTVGILGSAVSAVRMDSLEGMARADSSRLAVELARLASTLPMQTGSRFKGLSFTVVRARAFMTDARRVVVSHLVRRVPHEAAPVEEHTFILAERDSAGANGRFALSFHLRSEGSEDTAEQYEVLAALRGDHATWLLLSRDNTARTTYQVLERTRVSGWRSRWSRVLSC